VNVETLRCSLPFTADVRAGGRGRARSDREGAAVIEFLSQSTGNVLAIRVSGKLSRLDYRGALAPRIEALLTRFPTLRVLFLLDETFRGWSLAGAWANTVFDFRHRRDFDKIAMVGAPRWEEWCVRKPASLLIDGELRTFRRDQLDRAWEWLQT